MKIYLLEIRTRATNLNRFERFIEGAYSSLEKAATRTESLEIMELFSSICGCSIIQYTLDRGTDNKLISKLIKKEGDEKSR